MLHQSSFEAVTSIHRELKIVLVLQDACMKDHGNVSAAQARLHALCSAGQTCFDVDGRETRVQLQTVSNISVPTTYASECLVHLHV